MARADVREQLLEVLLVLELRRRAHFDGVVVREVVPLADALEDLVHDDVVVVAELARPEDGVEPPRQVRRVRIRVRRRRRQREVVAGDAVLRPHVPQDRADVRQVVVGDAVARADLRQQLVERLRLVVVPRPPPAPRLLLLVLREHLRGHLRQHRVDGPERLLERFVLGLVVAVAPLQRRLEERRVDLFPLLAVVDGRVDRLRGP